MHLEMEWSIIVVESLKSVGLLSRDIAVYRYYTNWHYWIEIGKD